LPVRTLKQSPRDVSVELHPRIDADGKVVQDL
jgi:hypothetical protein